MTKDEARAEAVAIYRRHDGDTDPVLSDAECHFLLKMEKARLQKEIDFDAGRLQALKDRKALLADAMEWVK